MRDDYLSADWAGHHRHLTASLHRLFRSIGEAFERLQAIRFAEPWRCRSNVARDIATGCPRA